VLRGVKWGHSGTLGESLWPNLWPSSCVLNSHFRFLQLFTYPLRMDATNATAAAVVFRRLAFISVLTTSCVAFAAAGKAQGDVSVEAIARASHSVVPVVCGFKDEQGTFRIASIEGTGFFVDTLGRFVTASHVLDSLDETKKKRPGCYAAVYIPEDGWAKFSEVIHFQYFTFVQCSRDTKIDLAVCQLVENPFTSPRLKKGTVEAMTFETEEQPEGHPLAFTGFPLQDTFPVTSTGIVAGKGGADVPGYFDYVLDKSAWPGASGSPLYLADGKVIGLLRATGLSLGSGLTYARSAKAITDFLAKNPANLPTSSAAPAPK
jgi:S1-C subfamily serine protease